jgi:hypothetical protein
MGGTKNASPEETQIMDSLLGADGYAYNKSSSTSAVTIRRLNCKTQDCHVQIKFERGNLRIAKYQKGAHNHLPPSSHIGGNVVSSSSPFPSVGTSTTAAGLNDDLLKELRSYASDLSDFNRRHGIDGNAAKVPDTIIKAAREIVRVSTLTHESTSLLESNVI